MTNEVVAAAADVRAALRTAFTDRTAFTLQVLRLVNAVEAAAEVETAEQFAVAA